MCDRKKIRTESAPKNGTASKQWMTKKPDRPNIRTRIAGRVRKLQHRSYNSSSASNKRDSEVIQVKTQLEQSPQRLLPSLGECSQEIAVVSEVGSSVHVSFAKSEGPWQEQSQSSTSSYIGITKMKMAQLGPNQPETLAERSDEISAVFSSSESVNVDLAS